MSNGTPIEQASAATEAICEVVSALACPYYRGEGQCASGCYTEPLCVTNGPTNPAGLAKDITDLIRALDTMPNTRGMLAAVREELGKPEIPEEIADAIMEALPVLEQGIRDMLRTWIEQEREARD